LEPLQFEGTYFKLHFANFLFLFFYFFFNDNLI
jgi:hypothetical protein